MNYRAALWTAIAVYRNCGRYAERDQIIAEHDASMQQFRQVVKAELAQIQQTARGRILAP